MRFILQFIVLAGIAIATGAIAAPVTHYQTVSLTPLTSNAILLRIWADAKLAACPQAAADLGVAESKCDIRPGTTLQIVKGPVGGHDEVVVRIPFNAELTIP